MSRRRVSGVAVIPWIVIEIATHTIVVQRSFVLWVWERSPVAATIVA